MDRQPVGFIGLGRMGGGMAANLLGAGVPLIVHDRDPGACAALAERGARVAEDAARVAAECTLVFLCLPFAPEVHEALFGPGGVHQGARPGTTVIDTTTLDHRDVVRIAEEAARSGIAYYDCPISGMPFRAENGTLTMMFGGPLAEFERVHPFLEHMGESIVHCGSLGAGQAMKAFNNIVYDVNIAAICEVLPLAVKYGMDVDTVARVLTTGSSRSFASEYFVPRILERRFEGDFSMGAAYKDIVNVQAIAVDLHAAVPVVNAMVASYQNAMAAGFAGEPKSAMIKIYERVLGIEVAGSPREPPRISPVPAGFHSVTPYLVVEDVPALIAFLESAFDAEEVLRTTVSGGRVMHAQVRIGDSPVMMGEATDGFPALGAAQYLYVEDVDAAYARAIAAGGESIMEPGDQFYGDRTAGVRGPGGVSWWLGSHVEDVPVEEIERRARDLGL